MVVVDDLMIRSNRPIDPFNRLGCTIPPVITVVEFCQIIGPKPLITVPEDAYANAHLDMDAIAVWLLSSETAPGTVLMIYNQQMGIYALSYHTVIYDVRARAFQRPICLSFLSSTRPSGELVTKFTSAARRLLSPLILCNRRLFLSQLSLMIQLSDAIENNTVQQYYALYAEDMMTVSLSQRIQHIADQARKLRPRMQNLYESLAVCSLSDGECNGHPSEEEESHIEAEFTLNQFKQSQPLRPIMELAPCTFHTLIASLPSLLAAVSSKNENKGVLYSSGKPVLRFPKYETPMRERSPELQYKMAIQHEETLRTITPFLDQVLYPVLAGDSLMVCGSEQRKNTVMDLVHKLNRTLPKAHSNRHEILWETEGEREHEGVFGKHVLKGTKTHSKRLAVLDTNTNVLRCVPYVGRLLAHLNIKRRFPSDASLLLYISASLTWLCSLVYVCRFVSFQALPKDNGLTEDDHRILANLLNEVDFVKYNTIKAGLDRKRSSTSLHSKSFYL